MHVDKDGPDISVLPWSNRVRAHQYSKPGDAGIAAGKPEPAGEQ